MDIKIFLPDTPENVIANHLIQNDLCKLFQSEDHKETIVQDDFGPDELIGYGEDHESLYLLLKQVKDWNCIVLDTAVAEKLGNLFKAKDQTKVKYLADIYHTTNTPINLRPNDNIFLLTPDKKEESAAISSEFEINGFKNMSDLIANGFLAYAKVSDEIVSITYTPALSPKYADIGTFTKEEFRGRGFSSITASVVINQVLSSGRVPVWSCGESNVGSLKVAQKLGFKEVLRRKYVIMPWRKN